MPWDAWSAEGVDIIITYLLAARVFIGLTEVMIIRSEGLALGEEFKTTAVAKAKAQIEALTA